MADQPVWNPKILFSPDSLKDLPKRSLPDLIEGEVTITGTWEPEQIEFSDEISNLLKEMNDTQEKQDSEG